MIGSFLSTFCHTVSVQQPHGKETFAALLCANTLWVLCEIAVQHPPARYSTPDSSSAAVLAGA